MKAFLFTRDKLENKSEQKNHKFELMLPRKWIVMAIFIFGLQLGLLGRFFDVRKVQKLHLLTLLRPPASFSKTTFKTAQSEFNALFCGALFQFGWGAGGSRPEGRATQPDDTLLCRGKRQHRFGYFFALFLMARSQHHQYHAPWSHQYVILKIALMFDFSDSFLPSLGRRSLPSQRWFLNHHKV